MRSIDRSNWPSLYCCRGAGEPRRRLISALAATLDQFGLIVADLREGNRSELLTEYTNLSICATRRVHQLAAILPF